MRMIVVWGQPRQIVWETYLQNNQSKMDCRCGSSGRVPALQVYKCRCEVLSSNSCHTKKNQKQQKKKKQNNPNHFSSRLTTKVEQILWDCYLERMTLWTLTFKSNKVDHCFMSDGALNGLLTVSFTVIFCFFDRTGVRIQGFVLAKQTLSHLNYASSPHLLFFVQPWAEVIEF
jgi:hypothetical protein